MKRVWALLAVLVATGGCVRSPSELAASGISSPDGRIALSVEIDRDGSLAYQVRHDGHPLIARSVTGLVLADGGAIRDLAIDTVERGGALAGPDHTGLKVRAREASGLRRRIDLDARVYNDGAAFRLVLPEPRKDAVRIVRETTEFAFPANALCLAVHHDDPVNSHEGAYAPTAASQLKAGGYYDLPLVCRTRHETEAFALTESGIANFSAAYLVARPRHALGVGIFLTPRHDDPGVAVVAPVPPQGLATPWRVVMVADRPERLVGSTLVDALAPPSMIGDPSWIEPGKAAWAWWSGMRAPTVAEPGSNDATYRRYIDFAGRFGLPYYLIDRGWAWRDPDGKDPVADITRASGGVDVPALVAYARARGVRLWLWLNWKALDGRMDAVLSLYQRLGIAGIKVDYLDRQDQEMVAFYHRLLSTAARHHLMVDIHASFVPRGLDRTYPNFVNQEGVMGTEYNRWSRRVTASHDVWLGYTRAILGPMDYAPGGFRNVAPAAFAPRSDAPKVMTTRAHQLALAVAYPSPFLVLADAPAAYAPEGIPAPGFDFLRAVPTTWDFSTGVAGDFGRWIAIARRKGDDWYIGILNDEQARTVAIPLGFLADGQWRVESWTDCDAPTDVARRRGRIAVTQRLRLIVPLAANGGAVLRLRAMR